MQYRTNSGRLGNHLMVNTVLPESVAARLEKAIQENPRVARELVHRLIVKEGGMDEDTWNGRGGSVDVRPPYDDLPKDWNVALFGDDSLKPNRLVHVN